jgi:hypothetical protein
MPVSELPAYPTTNAPISPSEPDWPEPASETMLSFALAVASQIDDTNLKEGLSAGLASCGEIENSVGTISTFEMVAATRDAIENLRRSRTATKHSIEQSRRSLFATRMLLRALRQAYL